MSFCKYSSERTIIDSVKVNNIFITEYLTLCPDGAVKTYLMGLYFCNHPTHPNNSLNSFSTALGLPEEEILAHFMFLEELNLVKVLNIEPIEIRYLPVKKPEINKSKQKDKYSEFCFCVQELIPDRMISTNEFYEYINFLKSMHMQPDALLRIIQYCTSLKGNDVGYAYVLTVAKAWAYKGLLTIEAIEQEIANHYSDDQNLKEVLKTFGIRRAPTFEEKEIWANITQNLDFDLSTILNVAKKLKVKNNSGLTLLRNKLQKYFTMQLNSIEAIDQYEKQKEEYYTIAKSVTSKLGVYYENLEPVIENYITKWINWGYTNELLTQIAVLCFKSSIRTLEGMDSKITKFYKLGIVSEESLSEYIDDIVTTDAYIKSILESLGSMRAVNNFDREMYKIWTEKFQTTKELMEYAISKSIGKVQPMQYLNKLLRHYHESGIKDVQKAKEDVKEFDTPNKKVTTHSYSTQDINSLFKNLDEIEV